MILRTLFKNNYKNSNIFIQLYIVYYIYVTEYIEYLLCTYKICVDTITSFKNNIEFYILIYFVQ